MYRFPSALKWLALSVGVATLAVTGCTRSRDLTAQAQTKPSIAASAVRVASAQNRVHTDVEALVNFGPRVAGTPVMEQASAYIVDEFRKAGYEAEIQTFTYSKFEDRGSNLTVAGASIPGRALRGTIAGTPGARLVVVPNLGRTADFNTINVKGAIVLMRRGEIPFNEKVQNAVKAGAIGVVIVNNQPGDLFGTLTNEPTIPVLALSGEQGRPLLERASRQQLSANLSVNAGRREVTGRNVVARLAGVTRPEVLLGGHYDSVVGSPGANDNASGTAVVLEIARNLSGTPLARRAWFVAFDGEEDGLHGSRAFVNTATPQFLKGLKGMFNFDMVGVNSNLGVGGTPSLTKLFQTDQPNISTFSGNSNGSDHASFAAAGVPILFFYRGQEPNYHTPNDKTVDPKLLDQTVQTGLTIVKRLLGSVSGAGAIPNAFPSKTFTTSL